MAAAIRNAALEQGAVLVNATDPFGGLRVFADAPLLHSEA